MSGRSISEAVPFEVRWTLAIAGLLLPAGLRSDWLREWYAEFWHSFAAAGDLGSLTWRRAFGAFPDAWILLRGEYGIARRIYDGFHARSSPVILLTVAFSSVALLSVGFRSGRNLLFHDDPPGVVLIAQPVPFMGGSARVPAAQAQAWLERSETIAELGRWSAGPGVCRADAVALRLFSELPVEPPCRRFESTDASALPFGGVVARLKSGASIEKAKQELAQTAALHKGWNQPRVEALAAIRTAPLKPVGFLLFSIFLLSLLPVRTMRMTARVWAVSKIALSFAVISGLWMELVARAPFTETAGIPASWLLLLYLAPAAVACSTAWWLRRDNRGRCRVCYRMLAMPVSVGMSGRCLLEPGCVEHLCGAGHGSLPINPAIGEESWVTWADKWA